MYAQANDAKVYHYYDSTGLEVDAIVQNYSGEYCAFEIKLGIGQIDDAAKNLLKFASILEEPNRAKLQSLNVIIGTGYKLQSERRSKCYLPRFSGLLKTCRKGLE